jgi:hypothetical protein
MLVSLNQGVKPRCFGRKISIFCKRLHIWASVNVRTNEFAVDRSSLDPVLLIIEVSARRGPAVEPITEVDKQVTKPSEGVHRIVDFKSALGKRRFCCHGLNDLIILNADEQQKKTKRDGK